MASTVSTCQDASPYQPRNYQLEMLEASMKENIIVAVCSLNSYVKLQNGNDNDPLDGYRERQNAYVCLSAWSFARLSLLLALSAVPALILTDSCRAVLRIKAELDICSPDKVYP